jgi:hypothetical protein
VKDLVCFRDFFHCNNLHHHNEVFELLPTFGEHGTSSVDSGRKEGCHWFSSGSSAFSLQLMVCRQDWTSLHGPLSALG